MKNYFLKNTLSFLNKYHDYSDVEKEKLLYGLEGIYLTITKLIVIIILAIVLNITKEVFILLILFNIIRYFGFGIHAKKSIECLITSTIMFIVIPYIFIKYASIEITYIISIISAISLIFFAPADTPKRPFYNKKKRIIRKILTVGVSAIYLLLSFYIKNNLITRLLLLSIILQAIVVNPITYKLLKQPYNNYKNGD